MKKLFIAAMLLIGIASFAQDGDQKPAREQKEKLTPEQRNEKQLQKLTTELGLDANQQTKVKQLLAERSAKAEKFREAREAKKDSDVKPTDAEKEAFKNELKAEKDSNEAKMKAILTADQYTKWQSLREKNKEKAKDKMKDYKKENN